MLNINNSEKLETVGRVWPKCNEALLYAEQFV
jgi:hypothetical protein